MSEPFIFIGTHRIREGKLDEFTKAFLELQQIVEEKEPRMIAFHLYRNEEGTEVSVVQVHPDMDSMLWHMQVAREYIDRSMEELVGADGSIQIYGNLSDAAKAMMQQLGGPEISLTVKPSHISGFTRSSAE